MFDRRSYYTKIEYTINNESIVASMKIDTGADYTIIGLTDDSLLEYRKEILQSNMIGTAYDASGTELKLYGYIVENFRLTDEITLDKIKLFFSEDIGNKALLGMDIL